MRTDHHTTTRVLKAFTLAILGWSASAKAFTPPQERFVAFKHLYYQEYQDNKKRMRVDAPAVAFGLPVGDSFYLDGYSVVDAISGASPSYYTTPDSFSDVTDQRRAFDLRGSIFSANHLLSLGVAYSTENDYVSESLSLSHKVATNDRNLTFSVGVARTNDTINPITAIVKDQKKHVNEFLIGFDLVLSPNDMLQLSLVSTQGKGYYSDPYKFFDNRPNRKSANSLGLQWNHHLSRVGFYNRFGARLYTDSFGIDSFTFSNDLVIPVSGSLRFIPSLRFYTQSEAYFFSRPNPERPDVPNVPSGHRLGVDFLSFDQRLSAFGAVTVGFKLEKRINSSLWVDLKYEGYQQKSRWGTYAPSTPGIADFKATFIQVGVKRIF